MKKIGNIYIFIILLFSCFVSFAQLKFSATGPSTVGVNEGFTINFRINASNPAHFERPQVSGARIVAGPYTSHSSNTSWINGKVTSSSSTTFSFTLQATSTGIVKVSPAKVVVNGTTYTSNALTISVTNNPSMAQRGYGGNSQSRSYNYPPNRQQTQSRQNNAHWSTPQSTNIQIDDKTMFVRAIPNKTNIVKGEEVVITYKLYTLLPVSEYQIEKIPSTSGFWVEEPDKQDAPKLTIETYNGSQYQVANLKKVIVYPQRSGKLTIKPMSLSVVAHIAHRQRRQFSTGDPFFDRFLNDPFFSSIQTSYQSVTKKLYTNALTFNVKDLPKKPDNYCGGVGKFSISSSISTKQTKAFDAFYLTYTLTGSGNLTLINNLPLDLPDEFQVFDPEITDNIQRTGNGLTGSRTFRYLVVPRVEGNFKIPELNISYFDIAKGEYNTISAEGYDIHVAKGDVDPNFASQLDQREKYRNMNIHSGITTSNLENETHIFDSPLIYLVILFIVICLSACIILYARQKRLEADVVNMKRRKATRVAIKRLKKAKHYLDRQEMELFEDETAIALWNYLLDRFKMDKTKLSIQNCKDELLSIGVDASTVEKLGTILDRCQYLRFSQDKTATADETLYNDTIDVISTIESQMKTLKKMKPPQEPKSEHEIHIPTAIIFIVACFTLFVNNATASANNKSDVAILCSKADSCFKTSDYANAMLYYEKAQKLSPANKDITLNINITRARLVGDTYIMPDFIIWKWIKSFSGIMPIPIWAGLFIALFIVTCVFIFFYIFSENKKVLLFYLALCSLLLSLSAMFFGIVRQNIQNDTSHAILMKSNIHLREARSTAAKDVTIMYKGQKIKIIEDNGTAWIKIQTEDHKEGFIENKDYKRI